jgi:hypothetical protein
MRSDGTPTVLAKTVMGRSPKIRFIVSRC